MIVNCIFFAMCLHSETIMCIIIQYLLTFPLQCRHCLQIEKASHCLSAYLLRFYDDAMFGKANEHWNSQILSADTSTTCWRHSIPFDSFNLPLGWQVCACRHRGKHFSKQLKAKNCGKISIYYNWGNSSPSTNFLKT